MILSEKITDLRKKNGWSQEELAEKLGVTRQAVSKWEGAQSVPDIDKILQMSRLFGVTTDYLVKDEIEAAEYTTDADNVSHDRTVTLAQAGAYLVNVLSNAKRTALGVALCILSPVLLILLSGLSETGVISLSEGASSAIGLICTIVLVGLAVALFILNGEHNKPYEFLSREPFTTEYGVDGLVKETADKFRPAAARCRVFGVLLYFVGIIPLIAAGCMDKNDALMLAAVCFLIAASAAGTALLVFAGVKENGLRRLGAPQTARSENEAKTLAGRIAAVYWPVVTAGYLAYSFITSDWGRSWIVWPVAAVLFGAVSALGGGKKKD